MYLVSYAERNDYLNVVPSVVMLNVVAPNEHLPRESSLKRKVQLGWPPY